MLILHILHILHALPPEVVFQLGVQHYHITYIMPTAGFFEKSILHILHALPPLQFFYTMPILLILQALPTVLVFKLEVRHYHITHITCITPSTEFSQKSIIYILHADFFHTMSITSSTTCS